MIDKQPHVGKGLLPKSKEPECVGLNMLRQEMKKISYTFLNNVENLGDLES